MQYAVRSPMGYYYRLDLAAPAGQRLTRRRETTGKWTVGQPEFSIQLMTAAELEHIARFMRAVGEK